MRFSVLRRKKDAQISDESDETENLENEQTKIAMNCEEAKERVEKD